MFLILLFIVNLCVCGFGVLGYPEEGKWRCTLDQDTSGLFISKTLFAGSQIFIDIDCRADNLNTKITIDLIIRESTCWNDRRPVENPEKLLDPALLKENSIVAQTVTTVCNTHIMLNEMKVFGGKGPPDSSPSNLQDISSEKIEGNSGLQKVNKKRELVQSLKKGSHPKEATATPVFQVPKDGFYTLELRMRGINFKADVQVEMLSAHGYLSAADWPLLPFYGVMSLLYLVFGIIWLVMSFCQWRELLRIQFWIGGVILLGMLEKATFYAEYQNLNSTGVNIKAAVLLAELVSCAKRTLARMLVIIVSLGFGIVKPRLGSKLHTLVGVGACYFIMAVVESYIRLMHPINASTHLMHPSNQLLIASIPLAVLDSAICWWIFTSLSQTMRTLRVRRNLVKLNLYQHFTNTLIFAVICSIVFMLYSIKVHRLALCVTDWKDLWLDEAFWHILFSAILLMIMVLWRPTNNNQRYAFTPLLDAAEDDDEEDQFVNDAYGVKMRTHSRPTSPKPKPTNDDDILKWVDENIPSAAVEAAIFDSEEEILTTKYEVSKMQ